MRKLIGSIYEKTAIYGSCRNTRLIIAAYHRGCSRLGRRRSPFGANRNRGGRRRGQIPWQAVISHPECGTG
jgi:hypothetical protein